MPPRDILSLSSFSLEDCIDTVVQSALPDSGTTREILGSRYPHIVRLLSTYSLEYQAVFCYFFARYHVGGYSRQVTWLAFHEDWETTGVIELTLSGAIKRFFRMMERLRTVEKKNRDKVSPVR